MTAQEQPAQFWDRMTPRGSVRRRWLQQLLGFGARPVVVASMSRAGSTILHDALVRGWARARFGLLAESMQTLLDSEAWRLDETRFVGGVVFKTHDLPEHMPRDARARILFTFRRATDVAVSVAGQVDRYGPGWFKAHRHNLRGEGKFRDFVGRDTLGLEAQVDRWSQVEGLDVLGLRYEALWDHIAEIEAFVGFPVPLPPRRDPLPAASPPDIVEKLRVTYAALDAKIDAMPDIFVRTAGAGPPTAAGARART